MIFCHFLTFKFNVDLFSILPNIYDGLYGKFDPLLMFDKVMDTHLSQFYCYFLAQKKRNCSIEFKKSLRFVQLNYQLIKI